MMTTARRRRGFSLVEVTIALGIAVFCLVVVFGLLSVALNTSSLSVEQTNASNLLAAVASDLRAAPLTLPKGSPTPSTVYQIAIPGSVAATPSASPLPQSRYVDANGQPVTSASLAAYQLTVWVWPGVGRAADIARIVLSWPPAVSLAGGGSSPPPIAANASNSVETVVALDRN